MLGQRCCKEFHDRFRSLDLRKETKKGTSVYNGIFNLLVLQGARDWMTGCVPQHGDLDDHHIVPSSRAADGLKGINVHTILNRTPLTTETNRHVIRERLPNEYLPELITNSGQGQVRSILESHFISPTALGILLRDPFGPDDYEAFISERQRTILEAIESLLIKERLDLSLPFANWTKRSRRLSLIFGSALLLCSKTIPGNYLLTSPRNWMKSIQKAAKKNAVIDVENFNELARQT